MAKSCCASTDPCDCARKARAECPPPVFPAPTFSTFILSLSSSTLVQLGEVPDPDTGKVQEDLVMAKHSVDILAMLQEKTKNGLDPDEARLLDAVLYELRMKYVLKTA